MVVQRKPGALRKPGGTRQRDDISSLVLHHDEPAVLSAAEMALVAGVPTKTHVPKLIHSLVNGTPTDQPNLSPRSALVLNKESEANVSRYDGLRQGGSRHAS